MHPMILYVLHLHPTNPRFNLDSLSTSTFVQSSVSLSFTMTPLMLYLPPMNTQILGFLTTLPPYKSPSPFALGFLFHPKPQTPVVHHCKCLCTKPIHTSSILTTRLSQFPSHHVHITHEIRFLSLRTSNQTACMSPSSLNIASAR